MSDPANKTINFVTHHNLKETNKPEDAFKLTTNAISMKIKLLAGLLFSIAFQAHAASLTWELMSFRFDDGGTAYGSFTYDSDTNQFSNIDIYTTAGSRLGGRHFTSTAGVWGANPQNGILAFSDVAGPNFTGAGWFRIDARIDNNWTPGTVLNQWMAVGAESFCINFMCNSAANEITNPSQSRDTIAGYLLAMAPVPEPSAWLMLSCGLIALGIRHKKQA